MKSTTIGIILFIVIVLVGVFFVMPGKGGTNGNAIAGTEDGVQKVVLSMKNYNYYPNTVTVNAGTPVRIYLDESVGGCYRDFTIRSFGVRKYLASPNDYVEFTPDKAGKYTFACSMGMGQGTLIVK